MATYPLQALLNVRKYREQNAQNAIRQAENAYREIEKKIQEHTEKIKNYHIWKLEEEERKYAEVLGQQLSIVELEDFRRYFALLKDRELVLEEELAQLEKAKEDTKKLVEQRKEEFKLAKKNTAKITAHKDIWKFEDKKEQERKEDLETEEFKPLPQVGAECAE